MSPATRQTLSKLQLSEAGCLVDVHHDNDRTLADQRDIWYRPGPDDPWRIQVVLDELPKDGTTLRRCCQH